MTMFLARQAARTALAAVVLSAGAAATAGREARAAFVFQVTEVGANVVVTGAGSLNLSALTQTSATGGLGFGSSLRASVGLLAMRSNTLGLTNFSGATGPASFGPGLGFFSADSQSGDNVGLVGLRGEIAVPGGYVSGASLSNSMTFQSESFATLGLTPGSYVWTWGSGATADSLTVNVVASPVPMPAAALLFGAGLLGLGLARRRD